MIIMAITAVSWLGYKAYVQRGRPPSATPAKPPRHKISPLGPWEVKLYFAQQQMEYLVGERRRLVVPRDPRARARALMEALISGPKTPLVPTLPPGTRLRDIRIRPNGEFVVDLNEAFVKNHPGGSSGELITLYSIVDTLAENIKAVKSVRILVEGRPRETLAGHISLREPLEPDRKWIYVPEGNRSANRKARK
jgi:germination protein M